MRASILVASVLALLTSLIETAHAQEPACAKLMQAYEDASKTISLVWADNVGDNSAPRATNKNLEMNNWLIVRQMNLMLMINSKCPLPKDPVYLLEYVSPALDCTMARLKDAKEKNHPACDRDRWVKRDPHSEKKQ